jgi:hypothetical protein
MDRHGVFHYVLTVLENVLVKISSLMISLLVGLAGYIVLVRQRSPYNLVFGLPLILIGVVITLNSLWSVVLVIFSPGYNRGVCKLCASNSKAKLTKKR